MDILRIKHNDFTLTFECNSLQRTWEKGCQRLGAHRLTSKYTWSDECAVERTDEFERSKGVITQEYDNQEAFFFEQTDYSIWIEFEKGTTEAELVTPRQDVNERFSWKRTQRVLMGFINYGNEIGRADFPIQYTLNGIRKHFVFSYDVLSAKLDYHHDWKIILRDIETEYRMLSLDYLRKTYHGISEGNGEPYDLIWWNIFRSLQEQYIHACRNIIERPRHRLRAINTYKRADQIKRFTPVLEQQFAEHKTEEQHLYYVEEQQTSHNTLENRFLKHTLSIIEKHYRSLADRILSDPAYQIADNEKAYIRQTRDELQHLVRNPFFRTIGKFEGLKQESLILQRDVNYSNVFRTYIILRKSFNLNDGLYRMETKDIATLYEIWCFIQVEKVVKELFGDDVSVEHPNRPEMNGLFTRELKWGEQSKIVFKQGDITLAELFYNPQHGESVNGLKGIQGLRTYTVPQRPDIVLQLTKDDLQRGMQMTYLFDAKYRMEKDKQGHDVPPDDAINQMHRSRDAIYYASDETDLRKEVLGGYILFPGKMTDGDHFRQTVDEVNIGAFPMRPGDEAHQMLRDFIADLMRKQAIEIVEQVIPQKGMHYEKDLTEDEKKNVLIGYYKDDATLAWINSHHRYVIRAVEADERYFNIHYVVLVGDDRSRAGIYRTQRRSPLIATKETLTRNGYPNPTHSAYYSYLLKEYDSTLLTDFDPTLLRKDMHGKAYYHPEVITLAEYKRRTQKNK